MRTSVVHIGDDNINTISGIYSKIGNGAEDSEHKMITRVLCRSIKGELTELQRFCLTEYYISGKMQKDIAAELGVSPSTVNRHINRAVKKLKAIASYYS